MHHIKEGQIGCKGSSGKGVVGATLAVAQNRRAGASPAPTGILVS